MKTKPGKLSQQAWMVAEETVKVMEALHMDGGSARFVGGCVRNALANRKVLDIDIATPLLPEQVIERLEAKKIKHVPTGLLHGTVTAVVDSKPFEITTLRKDINSRGRHADVLFTDDWETDAARRDFTINAMYSTTAGEVFDFYGGTEDLRLGRVVFVGTAEERIKEDILRILRFFRFYAHFGQGEPDKTALAACAKYAYRIPTLSAERIRQETLKLLESDRCAIAWRALLQDGIATHFLPEATNISALETMLRLEREWHDHSPVMLRLAALLDVTPEGLKAVAEGLRLSNDQARYLFALLNPKGSVTSASTLADIRRLVWRQGTDIARSLILFTAARGAGPQHYAQYREHYQAATTFRPPRFPLTGTDVMQAGVRAGPDVGAALKALENWWLAEDFRPGRTESLKKLREDFGPKKKG